VKFHRALRPGEPFTLRWSESGPQVTLRCLDGETLLAEGKLTFDPGAAA